MLDFSRKFDVKILGFALDRNLPAARTFTMETTPTTPTIQSRRVS